MAGKFKRKFKKKTKGKGIGKAVHKLQKKVAMLEPELKHRDEQTLTLAAYPTSVPTIIVDVNQGDTDVTRDGKDIRSLSLDCHWQIYPRYVGSGAVTFNANWCVRIIIFLDKDTRAAGTGPTVAQLLDTTVYTDVTLAKPLWANRKRFKILYDHTIMTPPKLGQLLASVSDNQTDNLMIKERRFHTKLNLVQSYNDATGTNLGKNMIYRLILSNAAGAANTNDIIYNEAYRLTFTDV